MRTVLYRLYVWFLKTNVELRQWLYQLYLRRRKDDLAGADLSYLNLSGANLSQANLREANLHRADLTDVNLSGADLSGADLTGARVTGNQLDQAKSLAGAILPDGTKHI